MLWVPGPGLWVYARAEVEARGRPCAGFSAESLPTGVTEARNPWSVLAPGLSPQPQQCPIQWDILNVPFLYLSPWLPLTLLPLRSGLSCQAPSSRGLFSLHGSHGSSLSGEPPHTCHPLPRPQPPHWHPPTPPALLATMAFMYPCASLCWPAGVRVSLWEWCQSQSTDLFLPGLAGTPRGPVQVGDVR